MDTLGGKELGENLWLAYREAQRVANSKIQAGLGRIRSKGHQIQVFSQKDDKLLPAADYDLRVKQGPSPDPHLAQHKGIKHIDESQEGRADVDSVVSLAGYHNTPRNAVRGNPQWMSLVWIDAYINDRLAS